MFADRLFFENDDMHHLEKGTIRAALGYCSARTARQRSATDDYRMGGTAFFN
jgi:hypothetical protein